MRGERRRLGDVAMLKNQAILEDEEVVNFGAMPPAPTRKIVPGVSYSRQLHWFHVLTVPQYRQLPSLYTRNSVMDGCRGEYVERLWRPPKTAYLPTTSASRRLR